MFGRRKYNIGHPVKGQWVFGVVERESGRTFLVPVPYRTADTLMTVIDAWIELGTTVISDGWVAYRYLDAQGYTHRTVNHTNTIESKWGHVKAYLKSYNRPDDYIYHFAHYMFAARCKAKSVNQFTKFLHFDASTDWSSCAPAHHKASRRDSLLLWSPVIWHHRSVSGISTNRYLRMRAAVIRWQCDIPSLSNPSERARKTHCHWWQRRVTMFVPSFVKTVRKGSRRYHCSTNLPNLNREQLLLHAGCYWM